DLDGIRHDEGKRTRAPFYSDGCISRSARAIPSEGGWLGLLGGPVDGAAEAPVAVEVQLHGLPQVLAGEVGPQRVEEDELRVRRLPQEEVRRALLTARAHEQIDVRHVGDVEAPTDELLRHRRRLE